MPWKQTQVILLLGGHKTQKSLKEVSKSDQVSVHSLPTIAILVPQPLHLRLYLPQASSFILSALWRSGMLAPAHLVLQLLGLYKYWGQGAEPIPSLSWRPEVKLAVQSGCTVTVPNGSRGRPPLPAQLPVATGILTQGYRGITLPLRAIFLRGCDFSDIISFVL